MENSRIFWIFLFIGFLLTIIFYLQNNVRLVSSLKKKLNTPTGVVEKFADSKTTETETVLTIPQEKKISMYINAFLDLKGQSSTYLISGWLDTYNPETIEFKFTNNNLPISLTTNGFPTKTIGLLGPSSENIADKDKILGSFTVSFYMQISNNFTFPSDKNDEPIDIEFLQIYMQTPYYVIFYMTSDSKIKTNVNINALVGNSVYTWNIAKTALFTSNMFTFIINTSKNENTPVIEFYMNKASINVTKTSTPSTLYLQKLTLGVSQLVINKGGYLDANLWAFVLYNSILSSTDITELYNFFEEQKSGYANLQKRLAEQEAASAAAAAAAANSASNLSIKLAECDKRNAELINKCKLDIVKTPPKPNWNIKAGASSYSALSDGSLEECSILDVRKFGDSNVRKKTSEPIKKYISDDLKIQYPFNTDYSKNYDTSEKTDTSDTPSTKDDSSATPNNSETTYSLFNFGSITSGILSFFNLNS